MLSQGHSRAQSLSATAYSAVIAVGFIGGVHCVIAVRVPPKRPREVASFCQASRGQAHARIGR